MEPVSFWMIGSPKETDEDGSMVFFRKWRPERVDGIESRRDVGIREVMDQEAG
jgi:hypothetical protein